MEGWWVTVKLLGHPLYFGLVDGFETSAAVIPSDPGAPLGQSLISSPRSAADALRARKRPTVMLFIRIYCKRSAGKQHLPCGYDERMRHHGGADALCFPKSQAV